MYNSYLQLLPVEEWHLHPHTVRRHVCEVPPTPPNALVCYAKNACKTLENGRLPKLASPSCVLAALQPMHVPAVMDPSLTNTARAFIFVLENTNMYIHMQVEIMLRDTFMHSMKCYEDIVNFREMVCR